MSEIPKEAIEDAASIAYDTRFGDGAWAFKPPPEATKTCWIAMASRQLSAARAALAPQPPASRPRDGEMREALIEHAKMIIRDNGADDEAKAEAIIDLLFAPLPAALARDGE